MTAVAPSATAGRSPYGTRAPRMLVLRIRPAAGHAAMAMKPAAAQDVCGSEPPAPARSGFAATLMVATPTVIRITRPARAAGRSASAVTT